MSFVNDTNPFAPPGETADDLWLEKSQLVGAVLGGVAYGVHVASFVLCADAMWTSARTNRAMRTRSSIFMLFIFLLFLSGTLNFACNTRIVQLQFIDNRDFPGGPMAWLFAFYSIGVNTAGNAGYIIGNFLADALLLWRVYVVWNNIYIVIFPFLVFLGSTAMSFLTLYQASRPDASLWTHLTVQFTLPYFSISIGLNVLLMLLLVGRLYYMSWNASRTLGRQHGSTYISIATMLVESAAPYAITGIIFIITYARNSYVQNLVLPVLSQIMCISPEVIILRVATGRAVTSRPSATAASGPSGSSMTMQSMQFRSPKASRGTETLALRPMDTKDQTGSMDLGFKENV
ncbi:uncharacterized protein BXZ73DRAFT_38000 [Epithele typhae]|uniref:uncharacterized protein n=1 Tax=Epithele typhae TaxID=378194 RepID=UPI0020073466|nr:uncharacterized protein BXZ73DRAFT_38000 [Epithele typhae]KAH9945099.1 hypothetical protein BXZ73DRAFT_38000 [Epithele typhae]